jgi:hypothetical protein
MIAYTEKLGFDVLTAPIAEVDRRTLSQAWYSALHLRGAADAGQPAARRQNVVPFQPRTSTLAPVLASLGRSDARSAVSSTQERAIRKPHIGETISVERRTAQSVLARRIERTLLRQPMRHATFTLQGENGRVHLSVRSQGERVHLVAVCSPNAREDVAKALQQVRFTFARRGIVFDGSLREHAQESLRESAL